MHRLHGHKGSEGVRNAVLRIHDEEVPRVGVNVTRIARGVSPAVMANELGLSVKTVSTYRARILEKMGMRSNAEIAAYAVRNQLVE